MSRDLKELALVLRRAKEYLLQVKSYVDSPHMDSLFTLVGRMEDLNSFRSNANILMDKFDQLKNELLEYAKKVRRGSIEALSSQIDGYEVQCRNLSNEFPQAVRTSIDQALSIADRDLLSVNEKISPISDRLDPRIVSRARAAGDTIIRIRRDASTAYDLHSLTSIAREVVDLVNGVKSLRSEVEELIRYWSMYERLVAEYTKELANLKRILREKPPHSMRGIILERYVKARSGELGRMRNACINLNLSRVKECVAMAGRSLKDLRDDVANISRVLDDINQKLDNIEKIRVEISEIDMKPVKEMPGIYSLIEKSLKVFRKKIEDYLSLEEDVQEISGLTKFHELVKMTLDVFDNILDLPGFVSELIVLVKAASIARGGKNAIRSLYEINEEAKELAESIPDNPSTEYLIELGRKIRIVRDSLEELNKKYDSHIETVVGAVELLPLWQNFIINQLVDMGTLNVMRLEEIPYFYRKWVITNLINEHPEMGIEVRGDTVTFDPSPAWVFRMIEKRVTKLLELIEQCDSSELESIGEKLKSLLDEARKGYIEGTLTLNDFRKASKIAWMLESRIKEKCGIAS